MRTKFDEQLEQLNVALITTGALCEDAISTAAKALLENDMELAKNCSSSLWPAICGRFPRR